MIPAEYPHSFSRPHLASLPVNFWLIGQQVSLVQRRGRYLPESMRHPGKMLPQLARRLIESYTKPDDWILDPMSGIGTTGVEAIHLGRNYVGIELEERWVQLQRRNLELAGEQGASGRFDVVQADARRLGDQPPKAPELPPDTGRIDAVITSPPYGDRLRSVRTPSRPMQRLIAAGKLGRDVIPRTYGSGSRNLGNLSDTEYLEGMEEVYRGCFEVLKPGGYLAVVIRPGRDRHRLRPLHHETARLCTELGFEFVDELVGIVSRVEALPGKEPRVAAHSLFLKRLAIAHLREQGYPVTLEQLEYVLLFRKPDRPSCRAEVLRIPSPAPRAKQAAMAAAGTEDSQKDDYKSGLPTALAGPAARRG
jgi:modification methylase